MAEIITDTLVDSIRLVPFLFLTYLVMEYLEHKTSSKTKKIIRSSGKLGPLAGALLGAFPQCGFSAAASNLYAGRVITLGKLIAVYLSTSDEMIPVFLSEHVPLAAIAKIVAGKVLFGMAAGFAIDFVLCRRRRQEDMQKKIGHICDHDHCHCDSSILRSSLKHTAVIFFYIVLVSLCLNIAIFFIGEETLGKIVLDRPLAGPLIAALAGLIPNCASSVVLTQLYIGGVLSAGSLFAGLLAGAGVGLLVLFRENRNIKENMMILGLLYAVGAAAGIALDLASGLAG